MTFSTTASFSATQGNIEGCSKNEQSVTADWIIMQDLIAGVKIKEVKSVPRDNRILTEIFRKDWTLDHGVIDQVFQVLLQPNAISGWHAHQFTTDRLFISMGLIKIALYDARQNSPTYQAINEFRLGVTRPGLVVIPPGVWHGIKNLSSEPGLLLNLVDCAYAYEDPDHWTLPHDTQAIPYLL